MRSLRTSQPAPIASNPGRFCPVGSAQLGDGFGEVVAYGSFCQSQRTRQFSGSLTVACAAQDQTLSIGERVFFRAPYLRGQLGIHDASATTDSPDRSGEFFGGPVLEKIGRCSSFQRSPQVSRAGEGRQNQDACVRVKLFHTGGELETAHLRHLNVG